MRDGLLAAFLPIGSSFTTSSKFRDDLSGIFAPDVAAEMSVLELGTYTGKTTAFLADTFGHVIGVEKDVSHLQFARQYLGKRRNVVLIALDLYLESWSHLMANAVDLVFIDAAHDYVSVMSDTMNSLVLQPSWIVFHDYNIYNAEPSKAGGMQVRSAVQEYVDAGLLTCFTDLGSGPGTQRDEVYRWNQDGVGYEGKACKVGPVSFSWANGSHTRLLAARHPETMQVRQHRYLVKEVSNTEGVRSMECVLVNPEVKCSLSKQSGTVGFSDHDGWLFATEVIAPSHANGSFLQQLWRFNRSVMEVSFLPDFTSFQGRLHVEGVPSVDVVASTTSSPAYARVLDASYLTNPQFPCCVLPPLDVECTETEVLMDKELDVESVMYMVARYTRVAPLHDIFPVFCDDRYALPCRYFFDTNQEKSDYESWPAYKVDFRVLDWLDAAQANSSHQLVKEAAAKISDLLRDEFAARSATSAVIHGAFRNLCPPSSPVRVAAIVAALLVQPYKTFEFGFLASLPEFQILISDLLNNLVTNSLEKDRVDSRVLVDAPFLQIVRSEGPPVE